MSFQVGVVLDGDFLLRLRNFVSADVRYPLVRLMANSTFVLQSPTRFTSRELDFGDTVSPPDYFYVDAFFENHEDSSEDYSRIAKIRLRERLLPKQSAIKTTDDDHGKFEIGGDSDHEHDDASDTDKQEAVATGAGKEVTEDGQRTEETVGQSKEETVSVETEAVEEATKEVEEEKPKVDVQEPLKQDSTVVAPSEPQKTEPDFNPPSPSSPQIYPPELIQQQSSSVQQSDDEVEDDHEDDGEEADEEEDEDIEDYLKKLEKNAQTK